MTLYLYNSYWGWWSEEWMVWRITHNFFKCQSKIKSNEGQIFLFLFFLISLRVYDDWPDLWWRVMHTTIRHLNAGSGFDHIEDIGYFLKAPWSNRPLPQRCDNTDVSHAVNYDHWHSFRPIINHNELHPVFGPILLLLQGLQLLCTFCWICQHIDYI